MHDYLSQYNIDKIQLNLVYSIGLDERIKRNMEIMAKENGFEKIEWIQGGPTISTHSGPGCFAISGIEH